MIRYVLEDLFMECLVRLQLVLVLILLLVVNLLVWHVKIEVQRIGFYAQQQLEQELGLQSMPSELTQYLMKDEGFRPKRYVLGKEQNPTIGYGHYIENEGQYDTLSKDLGFENKENLSQSDALTMLMHDVQIRRAEMQDAYPKVNGDLLDIMSRERFRWSPQGFDKMYGSALRTEDVGELKRRLSIVGEKAKREKMGGVFTKTQDIISQLDAYKGSV